MKTKTKGLEPIVAAVLLIVVAVTGAVLVYLWLAGYVTKTTSQAEQMAASEKLKIEAASLNSTTRRAQLYIRNLGGDKVTINTAYLLKPGTVTPLCYNSTLAITINPGSVAVVDFVFRVCTVTPAPANDYVIKVVTQKGTEFAVTLTAS